MEKIIARPAPGARLAYAGNKQTVREGYDFRTFADVEKACLPVIPAAVPGNFELDLQAAGILPADLYMGQAVWDLQKWEATHVWYMIPFDLDENADERTFLRFEGIDTVADIFLNGEKIGQSDNMFLPHEFPIPQAKRKGNELLVHITPAVIAARGNASPSALFSQPYNADSILLRKQASMYGWDILPRVVSAGIFRPVSVVKKAAERLESVTVFGSHFDFNQRTAWIHVYFSLSTDEDLIRGLSLTVEGKCKDSSFRLEKNLFCTSGGWAVEGQGLHFWWPKYKGDPNLYEIKATLSRDGKTVDEKIFRMGFREILLERGSTAREDGKPSFLFRVNGEPFFVMGTNWVPLDPFPSRHDARLPDALALLEESGCNTVRCWGGNSYETDAFYDFCDTHGILVWQDFALACAVYPHDEGLYAAMKTEATYHVRRLANHPSLALWAGDNECDMANFWEGFARDPNDNDLTRRVLYNAVRDNDYIRPYLPSSPYMDETAFKTGSPLPEDHLWGPRDWFKSDFYKNAKCSFASEIGYHGCPSVVSLKKYIPEGSLWPVVDENGKINEDWLPHAACMELSQNATFSYRLPLMVSHVKTLFGTVPDDIETFSLYSQISQAEAFKYFIESFRIRKWARTGLIWWNLLDGWPGVSDAVVDYYYDKKLAFDYIRRAQAPVCLMFDEPTNGQITLYAANEYRYAVSVKYRVRRLSDGATVARGGSILDALGTFRLTSVPVAENEREFYLIEWEADGKPGRNHYVTNLRGISPEEYITPAKMAGILPA